MNIEKRITRRFKQLEGDLGQLFDSFVKPMRGIKRRRMEEKYSEIYSYYETLVYACDQLIFMAKHRRK